MSHYSNHKRRDVGERIVNKKSTHRLLTCWGCGGSIVTAINSRTIRKICDSCKESLTTNEIKEVYQKRRKYLNKQVYARRTRPDNDKFIFNSPFRDMK